MIDHYKFSKDGLRGRWAAMVQLDTKAGSRGIAGHQGRELEEAGHQGGCLEYSGIYWNILEY